MNTDLVSININRDTIEPIVKAHIQTAIVNELKKDENLVPKLIEAALLDKVSSNGRKSQYSSDNKFYYIEVLCNKAIQEAAQEAMKEFIQENKESLKDQVKKELDKQSKTLAGKFVAGLEGCVESSWKMDCNVSFKSYDEVL